MSGRTYLSLVIVLIWAVSYIVSVIRSDFTGFEVSTPVMLIVATTILGSDVVRDRRRNGNGGGKK